jgi:phosphotransferase system HPr (HPr) family protein
MEGCQIPKMKHSKVVVRWHKGLHLRPAARLVQLSKRFSSRIFIKCGGKVADLRSILNILSLCATLGTALDIEVIGDDEKEATRAGEQVFSSHDTGEVHNSMTERNL